ncbi:hypothetical protein ABIA43_002170 [Bradyrhizobium sp. USDA 328]
MAYVNAYNDKAELFVWTKKRSVNAVSNAAVYSALIPGTRVGFDGLGGLSDMGRPFRDRPFIAVAHNCFTRSRSRHPRTT